jgi:hypothetical protein
MASFRNQRSASMKALIAMCSLFLATPDVAAQVSLSQPDNSEPRFGVGKELLRPVGRATSEWDDPAGIELQFVYRISAKRAWRAGYGFSRREVPPYEGRIFRENGVVEILRVGYDRCHQLSLGHQWYFGTKRLRPFVGADAYLGHEKVGNFNRENTYAYDSLQVAVGFGDPVEQEIRLRYFEGLHFGLGAAVGLEYRPHKHLSLQLRASLDQFWAVPLVEEDAEGFGAYRYGRTRLPEVGSGVFVQFEF